MTRSDAIDELSTALAKAQLEMTGAAKDSSNPFFNSKYADLASVRDACMGAMNKHGLSVTQWPRLLSTGEHEWTVEVETVLCHESGQWMSDTLAVPVTKADAQGVGSAITYARRYALGAIAGVAPEDDDANAAVGGSGSHQKEAKPPNGAMETVTVKILGIVQRPAGNGTKFIISASDRKNYGTLKKQIADRAKLAQEGGSDVAITFKVTQWGNDITDLVEVGVPEPAL